MRRRAQVRMLAGAAVGAGLAGCAGEPTADLPDRPVLTDYDMVVDGYNQRTDLIETIWAPAVVDVRFTTEDGGTDWEQGNGRFQFRQPDRLSLNVGKLGNNWFWIGCNDVLYWIFDLRENEQVVYFGRNAANGRDAADRLGWPVVPRDLVLLTGNTSLPDAEALAERGVAVEAWRRDDRGRTFLEWSRGGIRTTRYVLETDTLLPVRIILYGDTGEPLVRTELERHDHLPIRGVGGALPRIATHYRIRNLETGDEVSIRLEQMQGEKKINDVVFDLEALAEQLDIRRATDLDQPAGAQP
ncbi:MAG: hypothetical protein KDA21_02425 [Phycisphaerales bacterium]|nr:hypothetical protein [Phycisphaerales bacterium]